MGKCGICGAKVKYSEYLNTMKLTSPMFKFFYKSATSYKLKEEEIDGLSYYYCKDCRVNFCNFYNNTIAGEACDLNVAKASYNYLYNAVNGTTIYSIPKFREILEQRLVIAKNNTNQLKIIDDIKSLIVDKWRYVQGQYPQFVFPQSEEYRHVCATKHNGCLILIENRYPQINLTNKTEEAICKRVYQRITNTTDEQLFAINIIPLENILSYQLTGSVEHTAVVSGGGGGGGAPDYARAAMGGLLFGDAGAIIGAQTGIVINPIKSDILEFDSRKTVLNLRNASGQVEIKELPFYYNEVFMKVIPEKEINVLQAAQITSTTVESKPSGNLVEEMKQLKELLSLDLITQEEFDQKKKQLLKL